ncbi:MAG: hypothetical protein ACFE91_13120 [Promethearchaeota archaeon]
MNDCYDKILKASSNSEVSKYKILIKLMKDLDKEISNSLRIRNCLLFLINLYFSPDNPDYTYHKGKKSRELSKEEKLQMHDLLMGEFCN